MTRLASLALAALLVAPPALAQDTPDAPGAETEEDSRSLMKRGADLFFRGLKEELDPALKELEDLAQEVEPALRSFREEMGPALQELMGQVKDWSNYHPPEMLPNGDIILRRKTPEELRQEPEPEGNEIEL